jgi:hypothetical protein
VFFYITAEDVFGSDAPRRRGPQPLHTIPGTVAGLYDLGLRHHVRDAALVWWTHEELDRQPDWKIDRLAIRLALCGRERLGLEPGGRVAVFGRLGWLWPVLDFAAMGFGLVPVGLEHDLGDDALCAGLDEAAARVVFATDAVSAARLLGLMRGGRLRRVTLVAEGATEEDGVVPLERLVDLGSTLDTPERAQAFRAFSRQVSPDADALWHLTGAGTRRLTHRRAMEGIAETLRARPARAGDVAYVEAPRVSLAVRCALARFVGDGLTTTALGREGRATEDVAVLRPTKVLGCGSWLERAVAAAGPRWPGGLDRAWARRRIREALGGRLRWIESEAVVPEAARRGLALARVSMHSPGYLGG